MDYSFNSRDEFGKIFPSDIEFLESLSKDFNTALLNYLKLDPFADKYIIDELKTKYKKIKCIT
ncbi:MAG: hypothetical protein ACUVTX_10035 [Bacteroidales bacterium]